MVGAPLRDIDNFDFNRVLRAGFHARGRVAIAQAVMAKIAFADHASLGVVLRHTVGTVPGAVLAANTDVGVVFDYARLFDLGVSFDRTAVQAGWLQAVIAAHRQVQALCIGKDAAFNLAHSAPVQVTGVAVLFVARHHAALAAYALGHVEVEAVLLTRARRSFRNQGPGCSQRWSVSERVLLST